MQIKKIKMTSLMILLMLGMSTSPLASTSAASSARSNPCSGTICLNEVMPNPSGYDDAAWPGGEWAEIKNTGPSAVNVLNWMLQNSNGKTLTFDANSIVGYSAGNSSTWTIQPNDWMVIARNANTNFWMTNTADDLELYDANGTFIGSASWTTAGSGTSYVEDPTNSYADWIAANSSTPGASNSGGATPPSYVQSDLQFSEIFANPVFSNDNSSWPGGEWFEIYNNGSTALNLTGWSAQDAAGNNIVFDEDHVVGWNNADSNSWMIEPDGYRVIAINSTGDYGVLNNNQETLTLQLPNGSLAETISWSSALSGTSKVASSSGTWITSLFPTPEQVNVGWIPDSVNGTSDVFFNEVRANSSVDYSSYPDSDWIELHNNGSSPID
ncbi:MAG: lamin tail domain-containing protein, partial [Candidatus Poseidoniaceae archaeon]|nr:lamin tail domain-containing protein [Candidatus Poseidoniaceae archaeon]